MNHRAKMRCAAPDNRASRPFTDPRCELSTGESVSFDLVAMLRRWLPGLLCCLLVGCATTHEARMQRLVTLVSWSNQELVRVEKRDAEKTYPWERLWSKPDAPSARTALLLRKFNLEAIYQDDPDKVIDWLHELMKHQPTMEEVHALAELAYIQANWAQQTGKPERASRLYATSIYHAYQFLFDNDLDLARNAYDPQFRSICDVYNRSLEGLLRQLCQKEGFAHQYQTNIGTGPRGIDLVVRIEGRWKDELFERFELVHDYTTEGFENQHQTYGLGAPLIAIRKQQSTQRRPFEKYYPPELSLPLTAFLHFVPDHGSRIQPGVQLASFSDDIENDLPRRAVLSLYDPLEKTLVKTGGKVVPLESDITTPLAYGLRNPLLNKGVLATASLLNAEFAPEYYGMYMLEPYDPNKIPVVMVHGLWSSPSTWALMFNDLRANSDIHSNYQFWFYSYPTAQPFWISSQQMRADLARIREELDPDGTTAALDQMILVGHSMGGLVSTMQTVDSQQAFWNIVSQQPIAQLEGDPATKRLLQETFVFQANPSISRVVSIATPFRGSNFANSATRLLAQKLITLPQLVTNDFEKFARANSDKIDDSSFLTTDTSIDSLSPKNPIFEALHAAPWSASVRRHNVVGRLESRSLFGGSSVTGDGVVGLESASLEGIESQIFVPAEHSEVHQHPGCVLEIKRILLEVLEENQRVQARPLPGIPDTGVSQTP